MISKSMWTGIFYGLCGLVMFSVLVAGSCSGSADNDTGAEFVGEDPQSPAGTIEGGLPDGFGGSSQVTATQVNLDGSLGDELLVTVSDSGNSFSLELSGETGTVLVVAEDSVTGDQLSAIIAHVEFGVDGVLELNAESTATATNVQDLMGQGQDVDTALENS